MLTVVLTRLAISPYADRDLTVRGDERDAKFLNPEWAKTRAALFVRFALAGMLRQKVSPALWIVAVDTRIEAELRFLKEILPPYSELVVLTPTDLFPEVVRQRLASMPRDVLTIRLDSDDMLSPNFLSKAQRVSRPNRGINFPHGFQFFEHSGNLVHRWIDSNPTVGFRAVRTDMTVHDFGNHSYVGQTAKVLSIPTWRPMYLKVSHAANNRSFQPSGIPVVFGERGLAVFGLQETRRQFASRAKWATFLSYLGFRLYKSFPSVARSLERARREARS